MADENVVGIIGGDNSTLVAAQALASMEGIIRELLRTTASNPLMAAGTLLIMSEIFYKFNIIDKNKRDKIDIFVGSFAAGSVIANVLQNGMLKPSAQTLVYGGDQMGQTSAILGKLINK